MSSFFSKIKTIVREKKPIKMVILFLVFLEVAGLLTAVGFYIAAMSAGIDGFDLASTGGSILYSVVGSSMTLMTIGFVIAASKGKIIAKSTYSSPNETVNYGIHTTGNSSSYASPKKQIFRCQYCGYGTDTQIGKCPQCGGSLIEN